MNARKDTIASFSVDFNTRTIHSRHIMDSLGPRITGPAVAVGDKDVVHVLLLKPKYSATEENFLSKDEAINTGQYHLS